MAPAFQSPKVKTAGATPLMEIDSRRGLPRRLINVRKNRAGDTPAARLHKTGSEGRPSSCSAGLRSKAEQLLSLLADDPFRKSPPFEKVLGDPRGAYSRRIDIQHRLVYQIVEDERTVKVLRMRSHYE
jgi:Txe/YoeB family toxin of toxin-antitoxin system